MPAPHRGHSSALPNESTKTDLPPVSERRWSVEAGAAVHVEGLAVDVAGFRVGEEHDCASDVVRLAAMSQQYGLLDGIPLPVGHVGRHRRVGQSRHDRVHVDAVRRVLPSRASGERRDAGLGGCVGDASQIAAAVFCGDGRHIDEMRP